MRVAALPVLLLVAAVLSEPEKAYAFAGTGLAAFCPAGVLRHHRPGSPTGNTLRACASAPAGEDRGAPVPASRLATPVCVYVEHVVKTSKPGPPAQDITVEDLTPTIHALVESSGVREGTVTVVSRHTTTAITINEWESRLVQDIRTWLLRLAPPDDRSAVPTPEGGVTYYHNDIDQRPDSADERQRCLENGWDIGSMDGAKGLAAWRAQEPINAHSHLYFCVCSG